MASMRTSTWNRIPADRIAQIHLAGHTHKGTHILDTHGDHVVDEVWPLYRRVCRRAGGVSTLIEWDEAVPPFETVRAEALQARTYREGGDAHGSQAA